MTTTPGTTVTKQLVSGGSVETTPVIDSQGRGHWVEQFSDEQGQPAGVTVRHPWGTTPRTCTLHKHATFGDALQCVETFGTERHP